MDLGKLSLRVYYYSISKKWPPNISSESKIKEVCCRARKYFLMSNWAQARVTPVFSTMHLDYRNTLYMGLPLKAHWKLQMVQTAVPYLLGRIEVSLPCSPKNQIWLP